MSNEKERAYEAIEEIRRCNFIHVNLSTSKDNYIDALNETQEILYPLVSYCELLKKKLEEKEQRIAELWEAIETALSEAEMGLTLRSVVIGLEQALAKLGEKEEE